jgi:hypothetical protein
VYEAVSLIGRLRSLLLSPSPPGSRVIVSSLQTARQLSAVVAKSTTNFPELSPPHTPFTPFSSPTTNTHTEPYAPRRLLDSVILLQIGHRLLSFPVVTSLLQAVVSNQKHVSHNNDLDDNEHTINASSSVTLIRKPSSS